MKNKAKTIQEDINAEYKKLIKRLDKIFKREFGKMCPDFNADCVQCRLNLIYNNFKKELSDEFVGAKHFSSKS